MTSLRYQLLREGINSGDSGLVRDSFHVLRQILDRIDGATSGQMMHDPYMLRCLQRTSNVHAHWVNISKVIAIFLLGDTGVYTNASHKSQCAETEANGRILNRTWIETAAIDH
eukprot:364397_1